MKKIELLAPAGNFECLIAAVQSGADAVYLSGKGFGARSFADNFDEVELEKAIDYCHLRGVSVYVTVNTLVSDAEINELCIYLKFLSKIGADGIIVQDMGVLELAHALVPELPVHASTQMTVMSEDGVRTLEKLGVKRIVLAREVSLKDIKKISENTTAELEVFGHGALCMCYSGQCLMSSIIGGRSGNRGKCAQPCRMIYGINGNSDKAYYMSLKDLSSLELLEEIKNSGVASLKIEGRMKGAAYVAAVVGIYRKYLDNPQKVNKADVELIESIFNRGGFTDGYLTGKTGQDMFAFDKPDNPYLKETDRIVNELKSLYNTEKRKTELLCEVKIKKDDFPQIAVSDGNLRVEYKGEVKAERAEKMPITEETVTSHIDKTGGTPFLFTKIAVDLENGVYLSAKELNALRRFVLERFEKSLTDSFKRSDTIGNTEKLEPCKISDEAYVCEVTNIEQFYGIKELPYKLFYMPLDIILKNKEFVLDYREKIVIVPPAIVDESSEEDIIETIEKLLKDGFYGIVANNISFADKFNEYRVIGGFRLNIYNSYALNFWKKYGFLHSELSPELNLNQIKKMVKSLPVQVMVYGRLLLMVTENCVMKNGNACSDCGTGFITDRMGMKFPVIKDQSACRSVILNCKKTFMAFDMDKIKNAGVSYYRVYFTDESPEECVRVSESFLNGGKYRPEDFTRGHFGKGVL